jgi:glutamate carboxypeptidase
LSRLSYRPPLQPSAGSRALFERIREIAGRLNQNVAEEKRGGVSDANWLSHAGIPTVDGLGPLGDLDFTDQEYIVKETLFQRIELTAHLLLSLGG